jgi:hypothetical protein
MPSISVFLCSLSHAAMLPANNWLPAISLAAASQLKVSVTTDGYMTVKSSEVEIALASNVIPIMNGYMAVKCEGPMEEHTPASIMMVVSIRL